MDELLRQVGELLLGSVPTMILFLVLVGAYAVLLHGPLKRTLAERRARTEGAIEKAHAAIAAAERKSQEFEARLRAARVEIFSRREKQIAEWNGARDAAIAAAREDAHGRVAAARDSIAAEVERARTSIASSIEQLAGEILGAVLPETAATAGRERAG